jgi:hypothetical protein
MDQVPELRVLEELVEGFNKAGISYALGGSVASGVWGQFRYTNDIDISIQLALEDVPRFLDVFEPRFMLSQSEIEDALESSEEFRMFQLVHYEQVFKVDMFVVHDEFGKQSLERALELEVVPGVSARCVTAEDILIMKLRWYDLGNRVSDKQWNDLVQVVDVRGAKLDRSYVLRWAEHFGLRDLAEDALAEALPPTDL